jgi:hypothetical protein
MTRDAFADVRSLSWNAWGKHWDVAGAFVEIYVVRAPPWQGRNGFMQ